MRNSTEVIRYLAAGGTAAVANYSSRFIFSQWMPFEAAVTMAYIVGLCTGFVLMRRYAFQKGNRSVAAQATIFLAVNGVALLQTIAVSSLLLRFFFPLWQVQEHAEAYAHAVGVAVPVVSSYFGHKLLTFR